MRGAPSDFYASGGDIFGKMKRAREMLVLLLAGAVSRWV